MNSDAVTAAWWERRWVAALLILLTTTPLLWPDVPPLTDFPGHLGRYKVQLDLETSPFLSRYYGFEWRLIGNLGVDLLVELLAPLLGIERAAKLIMLSVPPLTAAGFVLVAREVHGRVPPTMFFAFPLIYGHHFIFGFLNFSLAMALAFLAFALWLRLGRSGRFGLRALLFVPIGALLWLVHGFGWAALGALAFASEFVRLRDQGGRPWAAIWRAGVACLPLAPPLLLMLAWRSGEQVAGATTGWFEWEAKIAWAVRALRDRWMLFDLVSVTILFAVLFDGWKDPRLRFSSCLAIAMLLLGTAYLMLPRFVFGSAHADMRLIPYVLAVGILAIRTTGKDSRHARLLAAAAVAFFLIRTVGSTASFWLYDRSFDRELAALDHIPRGARIAAFVGMPCDSRWTAHRLEHLPGLAIVRREAFSNDQWQLPGAQLLSVRHPAGAFRADPSQLVAASRCRSESWKPINRALAELPRDSFDFVWLIRPPAFELSGVEGMDLVWREGISALYRVKRDRADSGEASARSAS